MTPKFLIAAATLAGGLAWANAGAAQVVEGCVAKGDPYEMSDAEVKELYDCVKATLERCYALRGDEIASTYREWKATATRPGVAGVHGERFLMTYVNDTGYDEYTKFGSDGVEMPVGTLIAKESFKVDPDSGATSVGPLFLMEKVAAGTADEYGNWIYSAVQPSGAEMKVSQAYCSGCHAAFEGQDHLGYPLEEVRVSH
ncbi:recombinase [Maritimibacter sp. 55A14]|uniref:cytochrome P460 family protein n=1 Tax=Maritimibacter sp. 55A14 TaxID=2174844 RepID=UPI000D61E444|nr:cytochrome P460 family protein [Maritimibacter sp. 55A14]PWE32159.1 recombinase [Maritimibacter sp. 55A14]